MSLLPKGAYDKLISASLRKELAGLPNSLRAEIQDLTPTDAVEYLARAVADRARTLLYELREHEEAAPLLALANRFIEEDPVEAAVLKAITDSIVQKIHAPVIPLSQSALVTNQQGLNYHAVLRSELLS